MMKPLPRRTALLFAAIFMAASALHFAAGTVIAQPDTGVPGRLDALQSTVNNIETRVNNLQGAVSNMESQVNGIQNTVNDIEIKLDEIEAKLDRIQVNVIVDETECATGAVQCTGTGHTAAAAGSANHNPVAVGIQVIDKHGNPIDGLGTTNFSANSQFIPAGGPGVSRLDCPQCFAAGSAPSGLYLVWVHPSPSGVNWKSGTYYLEIMVAVSTPAGILRQPALAKIEIPF